MMKTKSIYKLLTAGLFLPLICISCNDSFMDRYPETEITDKTFFQNTKDLETYTNGLYGETLAASYKDDATDNANSTENPSRYKLISGQIDPKTAGKWSWDKLRRINYFMENYHKAEGAEDEINNYVGIARLFRANHYYSKVKSYSDVPWFSRSLQTSDEELLYKPQDSRTLVVDSIFKDLDFAIQHIYASPKSKTRLSKYAALTLQARIALHEGTFRKYHDELGLNDGDKYLKIARDAAKEIIDSNVFSVHMENKTLSAYELLFRSYDLNTNPEIIMYQAYSKELGVYHNAANSLLNYVFSLSRDLMEDYLVVKDGKTMPFHQIPGYDKMGFLEVFNDRDPRLGYTFMQPGYIRDGNPMPLIPALTLGGYPQVKFDPDTYDQYTWNGSYTDLPILRYGEVLLIYAEARAELGELTQNDLDITINKLRDRVNMPHMMLADILTNIDPVQAARYSNVKSSQKEAVYEVRRERRIELACEGFRADDIYRWKLGKLLEKKYEGIYIDKLGYHDLTGDGNPDVAIVKTQADADAIPQEDKDKYNLKITILDNPNPTIYLSEGDHGFIQLDALKKKFNFEEPKCYYWPLDEQDMLVNENLYQNPFWK